jgi:L-alanine-DL-glutamate epimerase-like enolase superfamily enzyme
MAKTDLARFELQLDSESFAYRTPMKFGGRVVNDVTVLSVRCVAESGVGRATGHGSMTMGVAWAWPEPALDDSRKLAIVVELARRLAVAIESESQAGHPLNLCHRFAPVRDQIARSLASEYELASPIPELAVLLSASPIEAALFDAHGKAANQSSYSLLGREHLPQDLSHYLDESYAGLYLDQFVLEKPVPTLPLYHLVGALDPLTLTDVVTPVGDGLPETLGQWIRRDGLTHLKIKLAGDDLGWDLNRVLTVNRVANENASASGQHWSFSLDFNERCQSEDYVLELLESLRRDQPETIERIRYIEQPTHRDLDRFPNNTMHRVTEILPVVIDESLIGLKSLRTAVSQGYSGAALKACKGHAEALLMGAVAVRENLYLCVQDLTCVGGNLLHSASLASHFNGVAAIESNGRQYCPAGNSQYVSGRFKPFFEIRGGTVPTAMLDGPGLGF